MAKGKRGTVEIDQCARDMLDALKKFITNKGWSSIGSTSVCEVSDNNVIKEALNLLCWRTLRGSDQ